MKFFALYLFNSHEVVEDKSTKSCLKSFLDFISNSFDVQYFIKAFWFVFVQVLFRDKYSELYQLGCIFLSSSENLVLFNLPSVSMLQMRNADSRSELILLLV